MNLAPSVLKALLLVILSILGNPWMRILARRQDAVVSPCRSEIPKH